MCKPKSWLWCAWTEADTVGCKGRPAGSRPPTTTAARTGGRSRWGLRCRTWSGWSGDRGTSSGVSSDRWSPGQSGWSPARPPPRTGSAGKTSSTSSTFFHCWTQIWNQGNAKGESLYVTLSFHFLTMLYIFFDSFGSTENFFMHTKHLFYLGEGVWRKLKA